eukprot:TRINITY_DN32370_c0_g1_i1.p1 TRINITY_DN32370_c0_g1~~TRINITY_DN32370_c0_g1_i1.p1  ORF type:complete len:269 (+),score=49.28 TRINITY_DN32370_c0_g1_i1:240-1046(+)
MQNKLKDAPELQDELKNDQEMQNTQYRSLIRSRSAADTWPAGAQVRVLRSVTLGCARGELDFVVVLAAPCDPPLSKRKKKLAPQHEGKSHFSCLALAVVEAKRNINDCAFGFDIRQENIAFFVCDESGYDVASYVTNVHHKGKFLKDVVHELGGERFVFSKESFRLFEPDPSTRLYLSRLFFVTRDRPLLGMRLAELGMLLNKLLNDVDMDLESPEYMQRLHDKLLETTSTRQAHDVIELLDQQSSRDGGQHFIRLKDVGLLSLEDSV